MENLMKTTIKAVLITLAMLIIPAAWAQTNIFYPPTYTNGGAITASVASTGACPVTSCVGISLPSPATTLTVGVTGTFSATLQPEESQDGGYTWTSAGTALTTVGTTVYTITGFTNFRIRASAYVSGLANINLQAGPTGGSGGSGGGSSNPVISANHVIDVTNPGFGVTGVVGGVQAISDGSWTNTASSNFTSPANDPCFTTAAFAFGSNDSGGLTHINPAQTGLGTLIVVSCHVATLSVTPPNSCTYTAGTQSCRLYWGNADDTAAINNVWALNGKFGYCPSFNFSNAGLMFISGALGTTAPTCQTAQTGFGTTGVGITGAGRYTTQFVGLPTFSYAGCTGGVSGSTCFFGWKGVQYTNIGWSGAGVPQGGSHVKNLLEVAQDALLDHTLCEGWASNDTALVGVFMNTPGEYLNYTIWDGCGGVNFSAAGGIHGYLNDSFFGDSAGVFNSGMTTCGAFINGIIQSEKTGFGPCGINAGYVGVNGQLISNNDVFVNSNVIANNVGLQAVNASTVSITGLSSQGPFSTAFTAFFLNGNTSENFYVSKSIFAGNGTGFAVNCASATSGQFHDMGDNTITAPLTNCGGTQYLYGTTLSGVSLVAQTNNIGATTIITSPATVNAQTYALSYDIKIVTAGTAGTITVNLGCPNATFAQPGTATLLVTAVTGGEASGTIYCSATASTAIQYSVTGIVTPGALSYNLKLRLNPQ
jgi:hypothetical protein